MTPAAERRAWAALLAVAAAWRGAVLGAGLPLFHDQVLYVRMAEHLAAGRWGLADLDTPCLYQLPQSGLSACYPPLYPALLAAGDLVGLAPAVGGVVLSLLAGLASLAVFARLLRGFLPAVPALVGTAVVALHPLSVFVSTTAFTESLYLLWVLGAVSAAVATTWWAGAAAGGLLGLAYLTRPEAVTLLPLVALLALGRRPDRAGVGQALAVVVVAGLVAAGPLAALHAAGAERSWHGEKAAFGAVIDQRLGEGSLERAYFALDDAGERYAVSAPVASGGAAGRIGADPVGFALRRVGNAWSKANQVLPAVGGLLAVACTLVAGALSAGRGRGALGVTLAASGLLAYALALNIVSQARLLALAVPPYAVLLVWTGHLVHLWLGPQRARRWRGTARWLGALVALVALGTSVVWSVALVRARAAESHVAEQVGPWLDGVTATDAVLVAHGPGTAYYARRRHRALPAETTPEQLCHWLAHVQADCVVVPPWQAEALGLALGEASCLQAVDSPTEAGLYAVRGRACLAETP